MVIISVAHYVVSFHNHQCCRLFILLWMLIWFITFISYGTKDFGIYIQTFQKCMNASLCNLMHQLYVSDPIPYLSLPHKIKDTSKLEYDDRTQFLKLYQNSDLKWLYDKVLHILVFNADYSCYFDCVFQKYYQQIIM